MEFIDILIYLFACFGLIFTMVTIVEQNNCKFYNKYYYIDRTKKNNELIIKLTEFTNDNYNDVINKLKNGDYSNIYDLASNVEIKYN